MPPRLHPRSKFTSSIFITTLAASFVVVGLPHLLPCPAPRVAFADEEVMIGEDGRRMRRRRRCIPADPNAPIPPEKATTPTESAKEEDSEYELASIRDLKEKMRRRECPVPKPGGKVGEMLGFKPTKGDIEGERKSSRPP